MANGVWRERKEWDITVNRTSTGKITSKLGTDCPKYNIGVL